MGPECCCLALNQLIGSQPFSVFHFCILQLFEELFDKPLYVLLRYFFDKETFHISRKIKKRIPQSNMLNMMHFCKARQKNSLLELEFYSLPKFIHISNIFASATIITLLPSSIEYWMVFQSISSLSQLNLWSMSP
jgi:hypothetical protein